MASEEKKICALLQEQANAAQISYNEGQTMLASLSTRYDDIISWAEMYDTASQEAKEMIVNSLISWAEVSKGYKVHVEFNLDYQHILTGVESDTKEIVA